MSDEPKRFSGQGPESEHGWVHEHLGAYLAGGLSDAERERFDAHINGCPGCFDDFTEAREADRALLRTFGPLAPEGALEDQIVNHVREDTMKSWKRPLVRRAGYAAAAAVALAATGVFANYVIRQNGRFNNPVSQQLASDADARAPELSAVIDRMRQVVSGEAREGARQPAAPMYALATTNDGMNRRAAATKSVGGLGGFGVGGYGLDKGPQGGVSQAPVLNFKMQTGEPAAKDREAVDSRTFSTMDSMSLASAAPPAGAPVVAGDKFRGNSANAPGYVAVNTIAGGQVALLGANDYRGALGGEKAAKEEEGAKEMRDSWVAGGTAVNEGGTTSLGRERNSPQASLPSSDLGLQPRTYFDRSAAGDQKQQVALQMEQKLADSGSDVTVVHAARLGEAKEVDQGRFEDKLARVDDQSGRPQGPGAPADRPVAVTTPPAPPPATAPAIANQLKIIRSGTIEFEVRSFDDAYGSVAKIVQDEGGFVSSTSSDKLPNGKVKGTIVVRVPPEKLDRFCFPCGQLGDLKSQKISAEDVTKHYTDTESELRGLRTMESRLLDLIKNGKGEVKDLIAAETKLGETRIQIEKLEGQLKYYDNLVGMATITITAYEKDIQTRRRRRRSRKISA